MKAFLIGSLLAIAAFTLAFICYDLVMSKPTHQEGVIKELLFIEGRNISTYTPYHGRKVGDHAMVVTRDEQFIAIVTDGKGEEYAVHCHEDHFNALKVGDVLKYKKYEGEVFHIKYFAHFEEE